MAISVATQIQDIKGTLRSFLESYFNGASHVLSGVATTFPACYVRMTQEPLPQDTTTVAAKQDKPLIRLFPAPGGGEMLRGKRVIVGSAVGFTKRHSHVYHLYVVTTEDCGGARTCDLVASLAKALLESSQANALSAGGLKHILVGSPVNTRLEQFWTVMMLLRFWVNMEYS